MDSQMKSTCALQSQGLCFSNFLAEIQLQREVFGYNVENNYWRHISNFGILIADYITQLTLSLKMVHLSLMYFVRM